MTDTQSSWLEGNHGNCILVVDDDPMVNKAITSALCKREYTVHSAADASEAISMTAARSYPLIFMDLNMPGMNGLDLCREIRRHHAIPLIFAVTAYASMYDVADCRNAGFDDIIAKPIAISDLQNIAADAFARLHRWFTQWNPGQRRANRTE